MSTPTPEDLTITLVPFKKLKFWPGNARKGIVPQIKESMVANGVFQPLIVQKSTNRVIAGNHRLKALSALHKEDPENWDDLAPVVYVDVNDSRASRMNIADNKTSDDAEWDKPALAKQLAELMAEEDGLIGSGFDEWEVDELVNELDQLSDEAQAAMDDSDESREDETDRGALLEIADVTIDEPITEVHHGELWYLGRHKLIIRRLKDEHDWWRGHLEEDTLFAPYPDPFITATYAAMNASLIMVQPNTFLAAHTVDKFKSMFPKERVEMTHPDA